MSLRAGEYSRAIGSFFLPSGPELLVCHWRLLFMIFWYVYCLNISKKYLVTSHHHRQGRIPVKPRLMRLSVSDMAKRQSKMLRFVLKMIRKGSNKTAHSEVVLPSVCKSRLFLVGFIVLSSAGDKVFTHRKTLPRARDRSRSFGNGAAVSSCRYEQE
ncbi:hypothetical protein V202x_15200 [Gimesia aquarii]|uniref:Uncharacterized protein n=1 Tax=Gimesia aquarii TaxID=2527964 RepID=A0A517WSC4_9PLAN|nr:hypothetical protein V202x_15200 [Gimesia aquarii]